MSTRTTLPRRPSRVSGGELSHAVAPRRIGKSRSTGSRAGASVMGNTSLEIGAGTPAGAPMAPARIAASEIRLTFFMSLPIPSSGSPQRPERRADLGREELRLFPRREVTALVDLVEVDEIAISALGPALGCAIDLAGKHGYPDRNRDLV